MALMSTASLLTLSEVDKSNEMVRRLILRIGRLIELSTLPTSFELLGVSAGKFLILSQKGFSILLNIHDIAHAFRLFSTNVGACQSFQFIPSLLGIAGV